MTNSNDANSLKQALAENEKLANNVTNLNKRLTDYQCQISLLKIELEKAHNQNTLNGSKTVDFNEWLNLMSEVRTATPERLKELLEAARMERLVRVNEMKKAIEELSKTEENLMLSHMKITEISHQLIKKAL